MSTFTYDPRSLDPAGVMFWETVPEPEPAPKLETLHSILDAMPALPLGWPTLRDTVKASLERNRQLLVPSSPAGITHSMVAMMVVDGYLTTSHGINPELIESLNNAAIQIRNQLITMLTVNTRGKAIAMKLGLHE